MPQTAQFLENPKRRPLLGCPSGGNLRRHLQLPIQIMRQNSRQHIKLIPQKTPDGNIIHLALRLEFSKDTLLGRTTVVIHQGLLPRSPLVRHDHLELIPIFIRNEQIQLDGLLTDRRASLANKQKTIGFLPFLWLQRLSKKQEK